MEILNFKKAFDTLFCRCLFLILLNWSPIRFWKLLIKTPKYIEWKFKKGQLTLCKFKKIFFGVSLSQNRLVCSFSSFSFIDPHFMQWHFHDLWFIYVIVLYIYVIVSRLIVVQNINKYQLLRIENICIIILIYLYRMALMFQPAIYQSIYIYISIYLYIYLYI